MIFLTYFAVLDLILIALQNELGSGRELPVAWFRITRIGCDSDGYRPSPTHSRTLVSLVDFQST
jgi:hypothetical protein